MNRHLIFLFAIAFLGLQISAKDRPCLILTADGLKEIRKGPSVPLFEKALSEAITTVDNAIDLGIIVPIPKDMAGGFTHEQHKRNYKHMRLSGSLYQLTNESKYAEFVNSMLMEYEAMFKTLPPHPSDKSYARGKLFWQCLNDANWLVYTAQAYDAVYDYIPKQNREKIENNLLIPYADYISVENPQFFNRIHNHSTWGNAAVGMVGLALDNEELINRALYGLPLDENKDLGSDNDGGFIYEKGQAKAGFLAQIENAFSPDGYYEEGPYYQRYAMTPFMLFATALENNKPELGIFDFNNGVLIKAVYALMNQTNEAGEFFPINDSQKGMSVKALSVVSAIDIAYSLNNDINLLSIAKIQNCVLLDQYGYNVAKAITENNNSNLARKSIQLSDGKDGKQGALSILRTSNKDQTLTLVFKSTGQGLGHGHFDKLGILMYNGSNEVLQDYGSARWVNMDQKQGGRYLPENTTWAKQTIAHNSLIVDEKSHFGGKYKLATGKYSDPILFHTNDPTMQIAIASDTNAYEGVKLQRTVGLINDKGFGDAFAIDIFTATSEDEHVYQMPYQFADRYMESEPEILADASNTVLGTKHGYQHVYKEGESKIEDSQYSFNWFNNKEFYTITGLAQPTDKLILARIGANDKNFNLRSDAFYLHEKSAQKNAIYASVIEPHGTYNYVTEVPIQLRANVKSIELLTDAGDYIILELTNRVDKKMLLFFCKENMSETRKHTATIEGKSYDWEGPWHKQLIE